MELTEKVEYSFLINKKEPLDRKEMDRLEELSILKYKFLLGKGKATSLTKRLLASNWWKTLSDADQQRLADRYYTNDDFIVTHTSKRRIKRIYEWENPHKIL